MAIEFTNVVIYPFAYVHAREELGEFFPLAARERGGIWAVVFSEAVVLRGVLLGLFAAFALGRRSGEFAARESDKNNFGNSKCDRGLFEQENTRENRMVLSLLRLLGRLACQSFQEEPVKKSAYPPGYRTIMMAARPRAHRADKGNRGFLLRCLGCLLFLLSGSRCAGDFKRYA
jgi:hypothetical protein